MFQSISKSQTALLAANMR